MNKRVYIYGLYHPVTDELRYIGKTVNLKLRLQSHIDYARSKNKPRAVSDWINTIINMGLKPIIKPIETCDNDTWIAREMFWIKEYRKSVRLLNLTDGGESNTGYIYSNELREVRRVAKAGRVVPENEKKAIAASLNKRVVRDDGIEFASIKEAALLSGIPKSTFHRKLHKKELINGRFYQMVQFPQPH